MAEGNRAENDKRGSAGLWPRNNGLAQSISPSCPPLREVGPKGGLDFEGTLRYRWKADHCN